MNNKMKEIRNNEKTEKEIIDELPSYEEAGETHDCDISV